MSSPSNLIRVSVLAALLGVLAPTVAVASSPDKTTRYVGGTFLVRGNPDSAHLSGHALKGDLKGYQLLLRLSQSDDCSPDTGCAVYAMRWSVTKDHDVLWGGCWKHRHDPTCSAGSVDPESGAFTLVGNVQGGVGSYADVTDGEARIQGQLLPGSDMLLAVGNLHMTLALRSR
jgi:hypothetical protein